MQLRLDECYYQLISEFDELYEKFNFINIIQMKKACKSSYEELCGRIRNGNDQINMLVLYQMFVKVLQTEKKFVMMEISKNIDPNFKAHDTTIIVSQNGYRWIKLIGKNKNTIENSVDPDYRKKYCIIEILENFKNEAYNNIYLPFNDKPELVVMFFEKPSDDLYNKINDMGISVKSLDEFPIEPPKYNINFETNIVSLDITILILFCSEICNTDDINMQLSDKIKKHMPGYIKNARDAVEYKKKILDEIKKYEKVIVCKSAWEQFIKIVDIVGRIHEKKRVLEIEKMITIVEDKISERFQKLKSKKKACKIIFGTAETYRAKIYTCNGAFLNSVKSEGFYVVSELCLSFGLSEKDMCE